MPLLPTAVRWSRVPLRKGETMSVELPTPEKIVRAIQARGSDAMDLRDAAHEAFHALEINFRGKWTRDRIHNALCRHARRGLSPGMFNSTMISHELRARAAERAVCQRFGIDYETEKWLHICYMETLQSMHIALPSTEWILKGMDVAAETLAHRRRVDQIIALGAA